MTDIIGRVALIVGGDREIAIAVFKEIRRPDTNMVYAGDFELMERHGNAEEAWEVMIDNALETSSHINGVVGGPNAPK